MIEKEIIMEERKKTYDIGVIIGRFQVHELHEVHIELIDEVLRRHKRVILFLGISPTLSTKRNPLDFITRKMMIEEKYGDKAIVILPLSNKKSDYVWSKQVDGKIREVFPLGSIVLYGSRDSFIPHYHGQFDVIEFNSPLIVSATEIRKSVSEKAENSKEFRAGVIYSTHNTFNFVHPVIDVAIMNEDESMVLLGRKRDESKFRFIGGFVDITDNSLEETVKREAYEETGLEIDNIKYITSIKVKDWRYRNDEDRSILTSFFKAKKIFGNEKGADDIEEVRWFNVDELISENIVEEHELLLLKLKSIIF